MAWCEPLGQGSVAGQQVKPGRKPLGLGVFALKNGKPQKAQTQSSNVLSLS